MERATMQHRIAVLDDYQQVARTLADWGSLGPQVSVEFFHDHLPSEDALVARLEPFDVVVIMRERTPFIRSLLARLPRLRLLVTTGLRNQSVDMAACNEAGITVCGTDSEGSSTAEMTWGLILALARRIPQEDASLRRGEWQKSLGIGLAGKTLGILGLGRLGGAVSQIGRAFGMAPIAWSQNLTDERAAAAGATRVTKEALFERSDVLTIHLVLSERSRGLVGAGDLARMKPSAILINTSRGPIVDEAALIEALRANRIAGAGIDVYSREPLRADDPICSAPNTVLTPHLGYVSRGNYETFYRQIVEDVAGWMAGKPVRVIAAR
jgi:phosphoglycerate dehydrogenase-like enzyme